VNVKFHRNPEDKDSDMPLLNTIAIIGVVDDQLQGEQLGGESPPLVYLDYLQLPSNSLLLQAYSAFVELAVRSPLLQQVLDRELREAIKEVAPEMAELLLAPMKDGVADSLKQRRLALRLLSGFGSLALVLTAIGLYGVLISFVVQRRKEIGIRIALGSSRAEVTLLVLSRAFKLVPLGLVLGLAGAWSVGHLIGSLLSGINPWDLYAMGGAL
jgi:ABC-type antimicrobial peptide transport system permease subunit